MRRLIAKVYKFLYQITGLKYLSFALAIFYFSTLNLLIVYGFASLVSGWLPTGPILSFFAFPYIGGLAAIMMAINFIIMMPIDNLIREKYTRTALAPVLLYSAIALVLYIYTHFGDKIFI